MHDREQQRFARDGYRCQYSDPNWVNSHSYGVANGLDCYLNPNGAPDAFYWQTTADRAFSGTRSLYFGIPLSPELGFTTPLAQLEAVRTEAAGEAMGKLVDVLMGADLSGSTHFRGRANRWPDGTYTPGSFTELPPPRRGLPVSLPETR